MVDVNKESMSEVLDLIHDEVFKIKILISGSNLPKEVKDRLERIESLAKYKFDIRNHIQKGNK